MKARWLFWLLVIAFVWLVVSRFTEIEKVAKTLMTGKWEWVLAAALLQVLYYIVYTALYQSGFDLVGVRSRLRELIPVTFASIFVNVAAPVGGTSGMALFIDDARRRGQSTTRAAVGTLLTLIADFSGFLLVLIIGLVFLFNQHDVKPYELFGVVILLAIIGGMTGLLLIGLWQTELIKRLLNWFQRLANRIANRLHLPDFLPDDWVQHTASEFIEASLAVASHPDRLLRTLLISLCAYVVDIASLYCLFLAFHRPVGFGILVAGFSMGILFWIVSVTPQGIGVVEGMMALVFTSLGIPADRATVIAIAFRALTFWLPLFIGFILARRLRAFAGKPAPGTDVWSIRIISILTAAMGVINILSAVTPSLADRLAALEQYSPFGVSTGGHLTIALAGFALLLLANGLWRRKRTAWLATIAILFISIPTHLIKGIDYEEAILAAVLAAWMLELRPHFHARSDVPSIRQGILAVLAALAFTLGYGISGFYLLDHHFRVRFGVWDAVRQTLVMFTEFYDPGLEPITGFGRYFADSIYVVGAVTAFYASIMLIRPVLIRSPGTTEDRKRATGIVKSYGHSSLARLTLLDDKLYFFSQGGSVISYVVKGRVALSLGDPIGPAENARAVISEFGKYCSASDWQPAFYQVLPDYLEIYRNAGFSCLCIGHEGIVDMASFTLAGGENKNIRTAVNRMTKLGYFAELAVPPHDPGLLHEMHEISDEWLTFMHGSEKRFSLGWFDETYLNDCPVMLIRSSQGWIEAFANLLGEYQTSEVTVDMMRHRQSAEHGQMDFLFVSLFEWARKNGYQTFNLGLSALSGIGEKAEDPVIERALHYIYEHVNQFYNFKGLHEFKDKYHPHWLPRYLVYPGVVSLPAAVIAIIRADSGDNLLIGNL